MKFSEFVKDNLLNWYGSKDLQTLRYSDGEMAERYLTRILTEARDLSEGSRELRTAQLDWPSTYHLSAERGNLLRWFDLIGTERVLEIGSGCGAISRFLGERGVDLYAIEGSRERSYLTALRCRDLPNVKVYNANIQDITPEPSFDLVIMIGVLEYAGAYVYGKHPWHSMLEICRSFLRPDGMLILAIENKLGLKYWTGCSEDHGAGHFSSIHGYVAGNNIQTFSKSELTDLLKATGFLAQKFFYPWPDYKLPTVIMHEPRPGLYLDTWLSSEFRDYSGQKLTLINERLAVTTVYRAGMLADMSNSFLVCASPGALPAIVFPEWVVRAYAVHRARPYWTQTTFYGPDKSVRKDRLWRDSPCCSPVQFRPEPAQWYAGQQLEQQLVECLVSKNISRFLEVLRYYRTFLLEEFSTGMMDSFGAYFLAGKAFDCIPRNIIMTLQGARPFDLEWQWEKPIHEFIVIARALLDFLSRYERWVNKVFQSTDIRAIISTLLKQVYPWCQPQHIQHALLFEKSFQWLVSNDEFRQLTSFVEPSVSPDMDVHTVAALAQGLAARSV